MKLPKVPHDCSRPPYVVMRSEISVILRETMKYGKDSVEEGGIGCSHR